MSEEKFKQTDPTFITRVLENKWELVHRQDLFRDCINYVTKELEADKRQATNDNVIIIAFKFLQTLCSNAVSSEDLDYMAKEKEGG